MALTLGYGFTEAIDWAPGSHHRLGAQIAGAVGLTPWWNLAAFTGIRHDIHEGDAEGSDSGTIVSSGLYSTAGRQLGDGFGLGVGLGARFHRGSDLANSLSNPAVDLDLLSSYEPAAGDFSLGARLGFRYDRSGNTAESVELFRPGDRLALGLSDFHALRFGLGGRYALGARQLIAELSGEVLLGKASPSLPQSPYRASLGLTQPLTETFGLQVVGNASLSARPQDPTAQGLAPVEPRAELFLRLVYSSPTARVVAPPEPPPAAPAVVPPPAPETAQLDVVVTGPDGEPLSDAEVVLERAGQRQQVPLYNLSTYRLAEVEYGPGRVIVTAERLQTRELEVHVDRDPIEVSVQLEAAAEVGQIRGLVRSFSGAALSARITVQPLGLRLKTESDGSFAVDVPPGKYEIVVQAAGHQSQRRRVEVAADGVVVLNADLRRGNR